MSWWVGSTSGLVWEVGSSIDPPPTFAILQAGDYRHGASCVLDVIGADGAYSVKCSPSSDPDDADAITLSVVSDTLSEAGEGTITVTADRGTFRYGSTVWLWLVQGTDAGGLAVPLLAPTGRESVVLAAPLADSGDRITAIPDLAATDQLTWWNALPSGDVVVASDGSFDAAGTVESFSVEAHVIGEGYTASETQYIGLAADLLTPTGIAAASTVGNPTAADVPTDTHALTVSGIVSVADCGIPLLNSPLTTNVAALESNSLKDVYFLFLDFAGEALRANSGTRTYTWGGEDWLGIGEIGGVSEVAYAADAAARPFSVTLSGADSFIIQPALSRTNYKGRQAVLYRGFLNADESLIEDPMAVWRGRMDVASATWDTGEAIVQIQCEPLAARLLRPNISRYSDQDHQLRWPGDKFYQYLAQMEAKDVSWGGNRIAPGFGGGAPGIRDEANDPRRSDLRLK